MSPHRGCPDAAFLARLKVFLTADPEVTLEFLADLRPSKRGISKDPHEVTIVRMRGDRATRRGGIPRQLLRGPLMTTTAVGDAAAERAVDEVNAARDRMRGVAREALGIGRRATGHATVARRAASLRASAGIR